MESNALTTPAEIATYRLLVLINGAKLEGKGLRRRGQSCLSILKEQYGLKGSRAKVIEAARMLFSK